MLRLRHLVATLSLALGAAVWTAAPASANTAQIHYDVEIGQICKMVPLGSSLFAPGVEVTVTVQDWEDPNDYVDFLINVGYQIQASPIAAPGAYKSVGAIHITHGAFVTSLTFHLFNTTPGQYLRIQDTTSGGNSEYHIRQLAVCTLPGLG
jgi:hypothetical protein